MLMGITWLAAYYLLPNYNKFRFLLTLVVGYIIGVFSVWWYWDFAPIEEVAAEILKKDGAPMVAAPFFNADLSGVLFLYNVADNMDRNQILPTKLCLINTLIGHYHQSKTPHTSLFPRLSVDG